MMTDSLIFYCPLTGQSLEKAPASFVKAINEKIKKRQIKNQSGEYLKKPIEGAWLRADKQVFYPVANQLAFLLPEKSIEL